MGTCWLTYSVLFAKATVLIQVHPLHMGAQGSQRNWLASLRPLLRGYIVGQDDGGIVMNPLVLEHTKDCVNRDGLFPSKSTNLILWLECVSTSSHTANNKN